MGVEQDDNFDIMGGMAEDAHAAKPILPPGLADSDQADIVLFARAEHINPTAYESLPADAKSLLDLHEKALTDGTILHHFDRRFDRGERDNRQRTPPQKPGLRPKFHLHC